MKVLVLGGTGLISSQIVEQLLEAGHDVSVFNRGLRSLPYGDRVRSIVGDKTDAAGFRQTMSGVQADAVIDMISFNAEDAQVTVETFRGSAGQLIFCSSSAAYKRPYRSVPIREEAEELFDDPSFGYAFGKAEMERYLQRVITEGEVPVTIIRPSLTYGIGAANLGVLRQNYNIVHRIRSGKPLVMFGDGTTPWSFTFAPDLAKAFVGAVGNERTFGQAYHATSEEVHIWQDLYTVFGEVLGIEPHIVHISSDLLKTADPALFSHLYYEKSYCGLFDNTKAKRDIPGFRPTISLKEGLKMMLGWYEREGHRVDETKDRLEDRLVQLHGEWSRQLAGLKY
ncbi:NAD-dependent epimerase/dehydratase family protein [Paenibacillus hamazuiensis]|uniref:NAD-dependent epimerase/dehydratase family protein n=1 Tax=Paenibacillus hamazuiensis TaxID=2936508 RepID=UPI00200DA29B|nr:NAD-dependent epimerase/dehydratase family protein [Paenibacillus hamazuiensis]